MAEREGGPGDPPRAHGPTAADVAGPPTVVELRDVNERLLIAGLREQELAAALAAERATLDAERARLAVILADMGDAVLVVDPTGAIIRTNAAYARMAGGPDLPLVPRDARGHVLPAADTPQARAGRGETFSQEFTLTAADGSQRWYEANGQPLHDSGAGHAVVVIRDITSSSAQRRLQDEFLSLASHELRTPLTSIRGYVDLLHTRVRSTSGDERLIRYAAQALSQMRRLTALVGDLTDVARLQSGKLTLVLAAVELGAVVERVVETARDLPPGHTIHLAAAADPLWLTGDAGRLEQVLFNLLTNAVAHAPSATPIDVRLRRVGAEAALEVQDYGRGIAADQLPHLFERFYQVARPDRPSHGGMGLGLFICQEVVTAHGGRIDVASTEGEGTTFTVWLPLA
ncbi:MAG: PAS domain-containing sensor histidine kinase [Chloroflexota bacterium]|nr:PAS domain-containing sensor histidine kinase [Chloroflexota bacterium]